MSDETQTKLLLLLAIVVVHGNLGFIIEDKLQYRNQNLTSVPSEPVTEETASAVTKAIFSHNNFNVLKANDFVQLSQFPNLKYIFFDHNNISDVDNDTFITIPKIKFLELSHNKLTGISNKLYNDLLKLDSLRYINLKRNPIKSFKNIDKLVAKGVQVEYDGVLGREKKLKLRNRRVASDESSFYESNENIDMENTEEDSKHSKDSLERIADEKNLTIAEDTPIKAYVVDHKQDHTNINVKNNFTGSIIFNFLAAFLVLVALPIAMIIYYFIHRNDDIS